MRRRHSWGYVLAPFSGSARPRLTRSGPPLLQTLGHPGQRALERRLTIRKGTVAFRMVADDPRRLNRAMQGLAVAQTSIVFRVTLSYNRCH
jgi:hypothetical protein